MSQDVPQHASRFEETYRPVARAKDLIRTDYKDDVLLYDELVHQIHHLDAEVAAVWQGCDGRSSIIEISLATRIPLDRTRVALSELSRRNLLTEAIPPTMVISRLDRRKMTKIGLAALPAIVSITAPIAKAAASGCPPLPDYLGTGACFENCHCGSQTCYDAYPESGWAGFCAS